VTSSTRYWVSRHDDGRVAALVRIREVPGEGLWSEYFRKGRWYHDNSAISYLMDPLRGDETTPEEVAGVMGELGYEWPGGPAPSPDDEPEPPPVHVGVVRRGGRSLAETAGEVAAGQASPQELHEALLDAQVFCEAGEQPGFVALGPAGEGVIPVFSSEEELARARGQVWWFATSGADLWGLLPEGYDVVLDIAGDHPLRLRRTAVGFTTTED
jgi:hypothetical protein